MKCICSALKRNSDRNGFTLVELIVVIAILAILSAVAYPVYTGYITKANEAADLVLLGQVNESFVSALYDVGYNDGLPEAAGAALTDDYKLSEVWSDEVGDTLNAAFLKYFAGNEGTSFKVYKGLGYSRDLDGFYGMYDDGSIQTATGLKIHAPVVKNGKTIIKVTLPSGKNVEYILEDADKTDFANSAFGENMSMPELMGEVDHVVQAAGKVLSALDPSVIDKLLSAEAKQLLSDNGYTAPDPNDYPGKESDPDYKAACEAYNNAKLNAIVMSVAQKSKNLTTEEVINAVSTGSYAVFGSDTADMVPAAALVYGVLTGYANSDRGSDIITLRDGSKTTVAEYYKSISDGLNSAEPNFTAVLDVLQSMELLTDSNNKATFTDYLQNGGGEDDISGYIAAMRALNDNTGSLTTSGALEKGFADEDLGVILGALFGGN